MSTRSRIGLVLPDGKVKSVYCHFDGYPEGVGATLKKCYNTREKIAKLLEGGDISRLGEYYDEEEAKAQWADYKHPYEGTRYYKDRGEDCRARVDDSEYSFWQNIGRTGEDYTYLFGQDYRGIERWQVCETPYFREF